MRATCTYCPAQQPPVEVGVKGIDTESLKELCRTNAVSHSMQDVDFCTSLDSICVVEVAQFLEEVLP